jgi:hypothetical protein
VGHPTFKGGLRRLDRLIVHHLCVHVVRKQDASNDESA